MITETDVLDPLTVTVECGECGLTDYAGEMHSQYRGDYLCPACHHMFERIARDDMRELIRWYDAER